MVLFVLVEADARVIGMGEVGLRTVCVHAHSAWGAGRVLREQVEMFVQVQRATRGSGWTTQIFH